jgi:hypothetical protein
MVEDIEVDGSELPILISTTYTKVFEVKIAFTTYEVFVIYSLPQGELLFATEEDEDSDISPMLEDIDLSEIPTEYCDEVEEQIIAQLAKNGLEVTAHTEIRRSERG